jgi:hypothetical protein
VGVGKGVDLARAVVEPAVVERADVWVLCVVVRADVGVLVGGVERAVVERLADPQAAIPSAGTTAMVVRWLMGAP